MVWKSFGLFFFAVKHNQPVVSINQLVVFMKTLIEKIFQSIVLEKNLLFS